MPAQELKLELTETVIINNPELALQLLGKLTESGSTLALDDFGTGHSGLDSLSLYPIGTMKIDRIFINQMLARRKAPRSSRPLSNSPTRSRWMWWRKESRLKMNAWHCWNAAAIMGRGGCLGSRGR